MIPSNYLFAKVFEKIYFEKIYSGTIVI